MKIGDLFLALGVDSAAFKPAVEKAAADAGKSGASKFSSTFATGLKVGSVIVGAAFGLMTKGAIEMEKSQGRFQAATGRSRDEAIAFSKDMNSLVGSAKTVGQSFDEISETGIEVSQQFGTTGEATRDLTEDILGFAKVTGQDASDAAGALDGVLTSFGLSADDAAGFMDKLVFSSQKYGTDAGPATLATLQKMAPALTTMGMSLDDGVELLNAFEEAEVDAGSAQRGLQKAIAELKPGENLDDLIAQIGAIEDPTLRAQKAIEIFGVKAGVGLAKIIQPGMTSLDEFGISADDAAGAVDKAADDMLTTSDKIRMFTEKAGGLLRGLGQDFGPLVSGLGAIGSLAVPFAKSLTGLFGGIAKSGPVKAAAAAAGAAASAAYSAGMKVLTAIGDALSKGWDAVINSAPVKAAIAKAALAGNKAYALVAGAGTALAAAIGAGWNTVSSSPVVSGAIDKAGKLMGGTLGKLIGIGMVLGVAYAAEELSKNPELKAAATNTGRTFFGMFGDEAKGLAHGTVFDSFFDTVHTAINRLNEIDPLSSVQSKWRSAALRWASEASVDGFKIGENFDKNIAAGMSPEDAYKAATGLGAAIPNGAAEGIESNTPVLDAALAALTEHAGEATGEGLDAVIPTIAGAWVPSLATAIAGEGKRHLLSTGVSLSESLAAGVTSADSSRWMIGAAETLSNILKDYLSPKQQGLELIGKEYTKLVAEGVRSGSPDAVRVAQQFAIDSIASIENAGLEGKKGQKGLKAIGSYFVSLMASGMDANTAVGKLSGAGVSVETIEGIKTKYPQFFTTGEGAADQVHTGFTSRPWQSWGSGSAGEWISGFVNGISHKQDFIERKLDGIFKNNSPPKVAPNIDKHGFKTGQLWAEALGKGAAMLGLDMFKPNFSMPAMTGTSTMELHHTVDIRGDAGVLDERKVADYLNEGAAGFAWNLEHAMSAVNSG